MKPIALGLGLLVTVAAGGAMLLSSGNSASNESAFSDRAERVMNARGRRRPQGEIANQTSGRGMFRSVEAWGAPQRTRFAADAPSRVRATDRLRAGNDATSVVPNPRQGIRPTPQNPTATTGVTRTAPGIRPGRGADARRLSMQDRARKRELDTQQRRLQMQEERLRRLQQARQRSARMAVNNRGGGGLVGALNALASGDSPGSLGGDGDGDGGTRDPNAPPTMDMILGLFSDLGLDPNAGGGGFTRTGTSGPGPTNPATTSPRGIQPTGSQPVGSGPFIIPGNGNVPESAPEISLVWLPIDNRSGGDELGGFRTNDLYLRSTGGNAFIAIAGIGAQFGIGTPIKIQGGTFFQHPDGTTLPPIASDIALSPSLEFDTFVSLGNADFSIRPAEAELALPSDTEIRVSIKFESTDTSVIGIAPTQDISLFPDEAFYLRLARITARTTITSLTGSVLVVGSTDPTGTVGLPIFSPLDIRNFELVDGSPLPQSSVEIRWRDDPQFNNPPPLKLVAPLDRAHLVNSTPTLEWEPVDGATAYVVRIAEDTNDDGLPLPDNAVFEQTITPTLPIGDTITFPVPLQVMGAAGMEPLLKYKLTYTWFIEAQFPSSTPIFSAPSVFRTPVCLGDANYDNVVDFTDISTVLAQLGNIYPPGRSGLGDADNSGTVDAFDTSIVLLYFNETCP